MSVSPRPVSYFTVSRALVLLAVIVFALAAFGVTVPSVSLVPLGLGIWAAAALVP